MASKRNSRVYLDEVYTQHGQGHQQLKDNLRWSEDDEETKIGSTSSDETASVFPHQTNQTLEKDVPMSIKVDKWSVPNEESKTFPSIPQISIHSPENRPANFGVVFPGVYRSSFPETQDHKFLQGLKLKMIVTLVKKEETNHEFESFLTTNDIRQVVFNMKGTKKEAISPSTMSSILDLVLDQRNYPLLLHCNHGKHRTGCVVAAMRKASGWNLDKVLDEYKAYATPKIRECDVDYIASLQLSRFQHLSLRTMNEQSMRFTSTHVKSFFRTLLFSTVALTIWMVSGSRIYATQDRFSP